jgi:fengycin family lipopeptide synthetase D
MGRPNAELENVVGMFVNMLPIRSYPNKAKSFKEFLAEVKQSVLNAYKNQDYPFENIVKKLGIKRDFSRSPLFDISFSIQEVTTPEIRVNDLKLVPYENSQVNALFEILLFGTDENENISFKLDYCRDLFKRQTMESLARDFISLLQTAVSNTEVKLEDLEIEYESKIIKQNTVDIDDLDFNL